MTGVKLFSENAGVTNISTAIEQNHNFKTFKHNLYIPWNN